MWLSPKVVPWHEKSIGHIRRHFGEKIAMYFAFLGTAASMDGVRCRRTCLRWCAGEVISPCHLWANSSPVVLRRRVVQGRCRCG